MGRGRAKAKQQKVARELKYSNQRTDFDALQRELGVVDHHSGGSSGAEHDADADRDDYDDWTGAGR